MVYNPVFGTGVYIELKCDLCIYETHMSGIMLLCRKCLHYGYCADIFMSMVGAVWHGQGRWFITISLDIAYMY